MRRLSVPVLWVVALGAMAISSSSPAGGVAGFGDIEAGRFYTEAVQWMVDNDITTGTSETCFSPDDPVTRGQAAAFLWRMEGFPEPVGAHPFFDVDAPWQQKPVSWMFEEGITTGTSATTYSPEDTLTRGQMAALIHRAAGAPGATPTTFPDVTKGWQKVPVGWMESEGITTGTTPTTFSPEDPVTRGQFAAFSHRWKGEPAVILNPSTPYCGPIPLNPGDAADCSDFSTQADAQAWFDTYFPHYGDVANLDSDDDGIACEEPLPGTTTTTGPPGNPGDTKNCSDFATQAAAQAWFDTYFPFYGDVANLDGDGNGIPCESLP